MLLATLAVAVPTAAQDTSSEAAGSRWAIKLIVGGALLTVGTILAVTSSERVGDVAADTPIDLSQQVGELPDGGTRTLSDSDGIGSQTAAGLALVGGGLTLVAWGAVDRAKSNQPSASLRLSATPGSGGVFYHRSW